MNGLLQKTAQCKPAQVADRALARHEIAVWLAMPGLEHQFHVTNLKMSSHTLQRQIQLLPGYDELEKDVYENWLSATRTDCVRLAHRRPFGSSGMPLLSQLAIMDDIKRGMRICDIAREYRTTHTTIGAIRRRGLIRGITGWDLPGVFELLVA